MNPSMGKVWHKMIGVDVDELGSNDDVDELSGNDDATDEGRLYYEVFHIAKSIWIKKSVVQILR